MHVEIKDGGMVTVQDSGTPQEERAVAMAAAAVSLALDAWIDGDEDKANEILRHAVHEGVPPMSLLLAGADVPDEVVDKMSPTHKATVKDRGGVKRFEAAPR